MVAYNLNDGGIFCGCRDVCSDGGKDYDIRGMLVSSCRYIAVAVAASGCGPAMITEQISRQRQGLQRRERDIDDRTTLRHHRDKGGGSNGRR